MLREITFESLWKIFKRRIIWLMAAAIIMATFAGAVTKLFITPKYSSTVSFIVKYEQSDTGKLTSSEIAAAQRIVLTFIEISKANTSLTKVIEEAEYKGVINERKLNSMLTIVTRNETEIFEIKVKAEDPKMAHNLAIAFKTKLPEIIKDKTNYEIVVLDEPQLAINPESPSLSKNVMLGGIVGFALLYFIFCLLEYTRTLIYTETDIKSISETPVIGQIVEWHNGSSKKLTKKETFRTTEKDFKNILLDDKTPFMITESFKTLRTNLFYTGNNEKCPVYVITSGMVNAGKSVVAANLALSYSQLGDKKILFIDADMRCPAQHKIFEISHENGLSDLLADNKGNKYTEYVKNINNLDIITSGRIPPNPSELLASKKMTQFIEEAKENYDIIIIDMPPVTSVADPGIIASFTTGYLYVIRSGYTDARDAIDSIEKLKQMKANIVGIVLNDVKPKTGGRYSGYNNKRYGQYAYKYSYKSSEKEEK